MEKIITTIVPQLLSKLSKDKSYYTQNDLSGFGFPHFLINRMTFHLLEELSKEFTLPGEVWVDTDSDELHSGWSELQRIIRKEIQLPAKLAEELIETSVVECVGMTIQPRKVIPELLFDDSEELDTNELTEKSSAITVNRFLVWSMIRYMEKREKEFLNITEAKRIIEKIDEKIVESYHPLHWLSLVKPLFELSGNTVHSDFFRIFFEHKGKNPIAKEFDLIQGEIKESKFVEILSSPNSIYVEGYESDQQTLFGEEAQAENEEGGFIDENQIEAKDEEIEDSSDQMPFHQTFSKDRNTEEPFEGSVPLEEEDADVPEFELNQELDEDDTEVKLIAPWDEDDEDTGTLMDAFKDDDDPNSELNDSGEVIDGEILEEESELPQKDQKISDASLLEVENEEVLESEEETENIQEVSDTQDDDPEDSDIEKKNLGPASEDVPDVDEDDEEEPSLLNRFMFDDSDPEDPSLISKSESQVRARTIYDELNLVRNNVEPKTMDLFGSTEPVESSDTGSEPGLEEKKSDSGSDDPDVIQKFSDIEASEDENDPDDSEMPMWKSFLEREVDEVKSAFQFDDESEVEKAVDEEESDEQLDEDGFIEEPIYDLTKKEPELDEKIGDLSHWMQDVRDKFIEELFSDSEDAYEQALSDIVEFEDWKKASRYIEKEIFTRNRIDIYDEIAVDFTDRLHLYFIENKS